MASEQIIKVVVTDEIGKSGNGGGVVNTNVTSPKVSTPKASVGSMTTKTQVKQATPTSGKGNAASNAKFAKSMAGVYSVAKSISNQVLSNVGTYTGNSHNQTKVNNVMQGVGLGMLAYANPYAAIATAAIQVGSTIYQENRRQKMETISMSNARARNGYSDSKSILTSRRH